MTENIIYDAGLMAELETWEVLSDEALALWEDENLTATENTICHPHRIIVDESGYARIMKEVEDAMDS